MPEDDAALDLRPDGIGIDDRAAIHRADHATHRTSPSLRDLDFGNLRQVAAEGELDGDATTDALAGKRLSPAGLLAASSSTALARGALSSSARRYATGSFFAAAASSSMKLSTTKTLCVGPTPRQKAVGMPGGSMPHVLDLHVRAAHRAVGGALDRVGVEAIVEAGRQQRAMIEEPVMRWRQATGMPLRIESGGEPIEDNTAGTCRAGCLPRGSTRPSPGRRPAWRPAPRG